MGFFSIGLITYYLKFQTKEQRKLIPSLIAAIILSILYVIIILIWSLELFPDHIQVFLRYLFLSISGLEVLCFFIFIEQNIQYNWTNAGFFIVSILFLIECLGFWSYFYISQILHIDNTAMAYFFRTCARVGYNCMPIVIFGMVGAPFYFHSYKFTKNPAFKTIFFMMLLNATGFLITLFTDVLYIYNENILEIYVFLRILKEIGDVLPLLGLLVFFIIHIRNSSLIFYIPYINYHLMILNQEGKQILSIPLEIPAKNQKIDEKLFLGLIQSLDNLYEEILRTDHKFSKIVGRDVSVIIQRGKYITAAIATEKITYILSQGLKVFIEAIEERYENRLEQHVQNKHTLENIKNILTLVFPSIHFP
jgi:hypothetical protein